MKTMLKSAVFAMALALGGQAQAATIVLNLNGSLANSQFNTFTFGQDVFNTWQLALSGLTPFTVNQGDVVEATITLDGAFTVPMSGEGFLGFNLLQSSGIQPTIPVSNSGSITFRNSGGATGLPSDTVTTNCGNCLSNIAFLGANAPFTFDSLTAQFTIDQLSDTNFLIDGSSLSYQLRQFGAAVPEPGTWAMMIFGFGMIGGAMRRRKQATWAAQAVFATPPGCSNGQSGRHS